MEAERLAGKAARNPAMWGRSRRKEPLPTKQPRSCPAIQGSLSTICVKGRRAHTDNSVKREHGERKVTNTSVEREHGERKAARGSARRSSSASVSYFSQRGAS